MTNVLDGLLGRVEEPSLRAALASEIERLRSNKDFGLVFERHLPEGIRLYSYPVKKGAIVQERSGDNAVHWTVRRVTAGRAELIGSDGTRGERDVSELVVVRQFGESICPGFKNVGSIHRGEEKACHTVINGENYHVVEALLYAMKGQVDVLYLDPPYNSGAKDWTYNNDYVDANDAYRHSKWLSYMEKRLVLGRKLLKEDAVMVVTIDEHEVSRLGVLLGQLFPDADVTLVTIVINPKGVTRPGIRRFSRVEEYAYFCFFGSAGLGAWGDDLLTMGAGDLEKAASAEGEKKRPRWKGLLRSGTNARRKDRKNMFYPVLIDEKRGAVVGTGDPLDFAKAPNFTKKINGFTPVWPVRTDGSLGNWGVGHLTLRLLIEKGYVSLGGHDAKRSTWAFSYLSKEPQEQIAAGILDIENYDEVRNVVDVVYADPDSAGRRIKTVWHRTSHDAGVGGTDVISGLLDGRHFTFPKSVYAVRDTLAMLAQSKKDALIVDFFGGSGTTAHATMMLNAEDGGNRRCVLITNNEVETEEKLSLQAAGHAPGTDAWEQRGIFYRATKPRVEAAVNGVRPDGSKVPAKLRNADGSPMSLGFAENVEFLEFLYLDENHVSRGKAFSAIAPLLWLKIGSVGTLIKAEEFPFAMPIGAHYGILFDVNHWRQFVEATKSRPDVRHAFIVTDSIAQYQQIAAELPSSLEVTMLYEDYLRNFSINAGEMR